MIVPHRRSGCGFGVGIRGKLRLVIRSGCAASLDRFFALGLLSVPRILLSFEDHRIMHVILLGCLLGRVDWGFV